MPTVTCRSEVDDAGLARLTAPRLDVVHERQVDATSFELEGGPFLHWRRTMQVEAVGPGRHLVTEAVSFRLAIPLWGALFVPLVRRRIRRAHARLASGEAGPDAPGDPDVDVRRSPAFWEPPDALDAEAATVLATLCTLGMVVGYLGTLITQTITYASDQFHASHTAQSGTLAAVRIGVLLALALVSLADRQGRRRVLLLAIALSCLTAALGAAAPNLWALGVTQTVSRGFSAAAVVLIGVIGVEEMPAGSRAYAASVMTLTAALGAGMCVWALPLAGLGANGWRALYVLPLLGLPLTAWAARHLPETRRFRHTHADVSLRGHGRRLLLLGVGLFSVSMFVAPASQLLNEFLRTERGFSASRISLFTLSTNTPAGIAVVVGGRLSDTRGRRLVAAVGTIGGTALTVLTFFVHGWPLWAWSLVASLFGATAVPALAVYGPELFPTALRGKANGILQTAAVAGSSVGLFTAGVLSDRLGRLGPAMALLSVGPLALAVLVLVAYPETARVELEQLNPEDQETAGGAPEPVPPAGRLDPL